jgi:hypothetical protein
MTIPTPPSRRGRIGSSLMRLAGALTLTLSVALVAPTSARAAVYTEETLRSGPIQITSVLSSTMASLRPRYESGWQIGIQPLERLEGEIHVGLTLVSDPALARGMTLEVWQCDVRWVNRACATGYHTWLAPVPLEQGLQITHNVTASREIHSWDGDRPAWIVLRITTNDQLRSDSTAQFKVAVWGEGFTGSVEQGGSGSPDGLAFTGVDSLPGLWLGLVVLVLGLLLVVLSRRRNGEGAQTLADQPTAVLVKGTNSES